MEEEGSVFETSARILLGFWEGRKAQHASSLPSTGAAYRTGGRFPSNLLIFGPPAVRGRRAFFSLASGSN